MYDRQPVPLAYLVFIYIALKHLKNLQLNNYEMYFSILRPQGLRMAVEPMMMMISAFWKPLLMLRIATPVLDRLLCNECGYISAKGD